MQQSGLTLGIAATAAPDGHASNPICCATPIGMPQLRCAAPVPIRLSSAASASASWSCAPEPARRARTAASGARAARGHRESDRVEAQPAPTGPAAAVCDPARADDPRAAHGSVRAAQAAHPSGGTHRLSRRSLWAKADRPGPPPIFPRLPRPTIAAARRLPRPTIARTLRLPRSARAIPAVAAALPLRRRSPRGEGVTARPTILPRLPRPAIARSLRLPRATTPGPSASTARAGGPRQALPCPCGRSPRGGPSPARPAIFPRLPRPAIARSLRRPRPTLAGPLRLPRPARAVPAVAAALPLRPIAARRSDPPGPRSSLGFHGPRSPGAFGVHGPRSPGPFGFHGPRGRSPP